MSHAPTSISIAGFATVLGLCADIGMHPQNPVLTQLKDSCIDKLSEEQVGVSHLCLLGEVACNLEGNSELLDRVLNSLWWKVNRDLTAVEASQMYIFLAHISDPSLCQDLLTKLNRQTETLALRLPASSVCDILHALAVLRQGKAFSLILKLNRRASHLLKHFSDTELIKLLKALIYLGQCDEALFASMEKHLPKRLLTADPELTSSLMEYCLYTRCRSEPIFEAVAESFVLNSESYSTSQIARQVVAMGRLNYLPGCAREMFKKLESVLSSRFAQFPPRALVDILHSCIHLERFPLNFMAKVFSPYFLQRLEVTQGECLDKNALAQLTQLNMSTLLECTYYQGPRLPYYYHVKKFASGDQLFETPMDSYLYRQIKGPLCKLLGGKDKFSTRAFTHNGYTIDVEISMDENGYVLPLTQWDQTHRRTALCLDGQDRFCTNTNHLLGKEATKRRHLHRLGYDVVQIPYYEFEKLETAEERMKYLQKKIFPTIFRFYR
ncbi:FAST kinase domain-containing protein 3, mitochondrial-like [Chanos chanos]|uniref:FAST kinase domain-containing protein 3, mitochondrial-like n=1 Tax=Chanos chanos TaxID=29144 RepID=A0A6J2WD41_CHACN|nr:FAST kinase domain-containing protein 3, mitochondrial-like [Chanos chanos]